jgi:hypothetical protein
MDDRFANVLTTIGAIAALALGEAKIFAADQFQTVEWVIEARQIKSGNIGLVNLSVGSALAAARSASRRGKPGSGHCWWSESWRKRWYWWMRPRCMPHSSLRTGLTPSEPLPML